MTALPHQTFGSTNAVWIGEDALISTSRSGANDYPHGIEVKDSGGGSILALYLTPAAAVDLRDFLTALLEAADKDATSWAASWAASESNR